MIGQKKLGSSGRRFAVAGTAAGAVLCGAVQQRAGAAPVLFANPVGLTDSGSSLATTGTLLGGVNFTTASDPTNASTTLSPLINGVQFTGVIGSSTAGTLNGGVTYTDNLAGTDTGRNGGDATLEGGSAGGGPAIYNLVVNSGRTGSNDASNASGNAVLTLNGLTVGQGYALQLIFDDGTSDLDDRYTALTSGGTTSPLIQYGAYDFTTGLAVTSTTDNGTTSTNTLNVNRSTATDAPTGAQIELAQFVADSTGTQTFTALYDTQGNRAEVSGFVLQAIPASSVPEPASTAALAVAAAGLLAGRRRRPAAGR